MGVYFSYEMIDNHWFVGPIFGAVVLFWYWTLIPEPKIPGSICFFLTSTAIYALVLELTQRDLPNAGIFQFLDPAIITGTILLPVAHKLFLGGSWAKTAVAIPGIYLICFGGAQLSNFLSLGAPYSSFVNSMSFWQGAYLIFMFRR